MILKKTFIEYIVFGAKSFQCSIWEKHNMQNTSEKSLHFRIAQAPIYYAGDQVTQTVIFRVQLALKTSFLCQNMLKVWLPIQL